MDDSNSAFHTLIKWI